ncbi:uncharacterized protein [Pyrus communis]|uniref:uncharacterized protein n=1 Tax=Pyrus communis TaxID=23211 RepID=UPI0035BF282A
MADFIVEFTGWCLYVGRSVNPNGAGVKLVLFIPNDTIMSQTLKLGFYASNNKAEYEAFLAGLRVTFELQVKEISIYYNSLLVANQVTGKYAVHDPIMALYLAKAKKPLNKFTKFDIHQLLRMKNSM